MHTALDTLERLNAALIRSQNGQLPQSEMVRLWREESALLNLPSRFTDVLTPLLDRIEASVLFSEESCSFSQKDLLTHLQLWSDKARLKLASPGPLEAQNTGVGAAVVGSDNPGTGSSVGAGGA